jgi:hypothetical protein
MSGQEWRDGYLAGKENGRKRVEGNLLKKLISLGTVRTSMLGGNWLVIQTEKGAMDITTERLFTDE